MSYSFNWNVKKHKTYHVLRPLGVTVVHAGYSIECTGRENVPNSGGFILACNHVEALDPVILAVCSGRTCHFMAKSEFFQGRIIGSFLSSVNAFPVKRDRADGRAVKYACEILETGDVFGIFPEGRRNMERSEPKKAKSGVAHIAYAAKADVLPACLYYSDKRILGRRRVSVRFGNLISAEELSINNSPQAMHETADRIMNCISELWFEERKRIG